MFTLANLVPALVADYPMFMTARVLVGAVQGLFIAGAFVTATSIVPPERAGRAMAIVVSGFATSSAIGLPVGTLLGQAVGWRWSFAAVVAVGVVVLAPWPPSCCPPSRRPGTTGRPARSGRRSPRGCWRCSG